MFRKSISLISTPYLMLAEFILSYAQKYRNTFNEVLECNLEYRYGSLGILKNNETEKSLSEKRDNIKYSYNTKRDTEHIRYAQY